jgi:hypothetical protein
MKKAFYLRQFVLLRLVVIASCVGVPFLSFAQPPHPPGDGPINPMKVGSVTITGGIGAGSDYENDFYNDRLGLKAVIEWGLLQLGPGVITLGGEVGGSFSSGGYINYDNYHAQTIAVGGRAAWHYGWGVRGLDTYGGVSGILGYHHYQYYDPPDKFSHDKAIAEPGAFVGASYFITPFFGLNAEVGHDITDFQIGIVVRTRR